MSEMINDYIDNELDRRGKADRNGDGSGGGDDDGSFDGAPTEAQAEALRQYFLGTQPDAGTAAHILSRPSYEAGKDYDEIAMEIFVLWSLLNRPRNGPHSSGGGALSWKDGFQDHMVVELVDAFLGGRSGWLANPPEQFVNACAWAARLHSACLTSAAMPLVSCHIPNALEAEDGTSDPTSVSAAAQVFAHGGASWVLDACQKGWEIPSRDGERYSTDRWDRWMQRWQALGKQEGPAGREALAALEGARAAIRNDTST